MTEQITDYYTKGILAQAFQAERNILIWQNIGEESEFLKTKDEYVQKMYIYIQQSAQTNFVLALGKLFDKPNKKFETRCILSFLNLLKSLDFEPIKIIETTNTKKALEDNNCPRALVDAVDSDDPRLFPGLFAEYYLNKYEETTLQTNIDTMKVMRDKAEAHNEVTGTLALDFETTSKLLAFALEIISIFGMAYRSEIYHIGGKSFVTINAERDIGFIKVMIGRLKEEEET